MKQVSLKLRPKGFFAGITTNSSYIWTLAQKYLERHATPTYPMRIESQLWTLVLPQGDMFSSIGTPLSIRYRSEMRMTRIPETEYLVHAPTLFHYCDTFGLEWIDWMSGRDWWSCHRNIGFGRLMEMGVVTKDSRYLSKEEYEMLGIFACFVTIKHSLNQ